MDMQNIDVLLEPLRALLQQVGSFTPRLLLAAALLLGGWLSPRRSASAS
jgi:hypothetical protein